jgi:hypothetical protein
VKLAALITALLSAAFGVAAALAMTRGAQAVPWSMQSYSGQSDAEKAFRQKTSGWFTVGLGFLAATFVLAAASAVLGYLAP